MIEEIWKEITGYEKYYEVSTLGNVRAIEREVRYSDGRVYKYASKDIKKQVNLSNGYVYVSLCKSSISKFHTVHSLVANAFIGSRPEKYDVCHNDGNRQNNEVSNLRYATRSENLRQMREHGTGPHGERGPTSVLKEWQVLEIREMISQKRTLREMADKYGVAASTIQGIRDGRTWDYLGPVDWIKKKKN